MEIKNKYQYNRQIFIPHVIACTYKLLKPRLILVNGQDQDRKASSQARVKSIDFACLYDLPIILVFVFYFHFISTFYMYIVTTIFIGKEMVMTYSIFIS
jgi:hypothetical protein